MSTTTLERPRHAIDPRIRARRIEVQRGAGRRRLQRLVDLGLLLAVVAGFALALRSPLLDVDEVRVAGAAHTTADAVLERSGLQAGDQLMDVDLRAAGESIATLPWVHEVRLHRGLDGVIEISITERTAVAVAGEGDDAYFVDVEGRVLAPAASDAVLAATLVRVVDARAGLEPGDGLGAASTEALRVAERLATAVPGAVATVAVDGEVTATLVQGGTVRFGDAGQLEAKVRSLRTMLDRVDLGCLATIDLRSPSSAVLTREEGCF
jgi:cell division protein FtsQ